MKKFTSYRVRFLIMLAFLVIVALGYFTIQGIGNACGFGFDSITLLCPLGALLSMIAERTAIPMALVSVIVVLLICIVLGKVFCSWICPVHFMSRLTRKNKKKDKHLPANGSKHHSNTSPPGIPSDEGADAPESSIVISTTSDTPAPSKKKVFATGCSNCKTPCGKSKGIKIDSRHGILAAALGSTLIFGFPVFCLICPVGLTFATVLLVMRLFAFGDTTWTIIAFPLIILIELLLIPKWCQNFCPLGALLSLFSGPNKTFRPTVDANKCITLADNKACNLCEKVCPEGINLLNIAAGETTMNDCSKCRACADACPTKCITFPFLPPKDLRPNTSVAGYVPEQSASSGLTTEIEKG